MNIRFFALLICCLPALSFAAAPAKLLTPAELPSAKTAVKLDAAPVQRVAPPDVQKALVEDMAEPRGLYRYALPVQHNIKIELDTTSTGWSQLADGSWLWRTQIEAPGATSIDLGFSRYRLPHGAKLYAYGEQSGIGFGPFTDAHNFAHGELWLPVVPGDLLTLELVVPDTQKEFLELELGTVHYGYRSLPGVTSFGGQQKSETCNVDVACPEAQPFAKQAEAVARYQVGGGLCTGQLLNNTAQDDSPLFLTANHCGINSVNDAQIVLYWNFKSDTCRTPGSIESGTPLNPDQDGVIQVGGGTLLANTLSSDVSLVRLSANPPAQADVFFLGWDRSGNAPPSAFAFHHPAGDEMRIAIEDDPVVSNASTPLFDPNLAPGSSWEVLEWDVGITEGGSSGSALIDQNRRVVGQLAGGALFICPGAEEGSDIFAKFSLSWEGEGSSDSRLSDWLDPTGTNPLTLDGKDDCEAPDVSISSGLNPAQVGQVVQLRAQASGNGPFRFEWDTDADGIFEIEGDTVNAVYSGPLAGNVRVRVTDAAECFTVESFAQSISTPRVVLDNAVAASEVCGDGDQTVEPGEQWRYLVTLRNEGNVPARDAVAAFRVAPALAKSIASKATGGPDAFGYSFEDSAEPTCAFDYQDIASTQNRAFGIADDAGALIELGNAPFPFYGEEADFLVMSSNGYLSTLLDDGGEDFSNDCPLPQVPSANFIGQSFVYEDAGRIMPLHDDLIVNDAAYHQSFTICPRAHQSGANLGCEIFQWDDVDYFDVFSPQFSFQALLYENGDIVYQYLPGQVGDIAFAASVGIQNAPATIALTYTCNGSGPVISEPSAVCIRAGEVVEQISREIVLGQPGQAVGTLDPGDSVEVDLIAQISADASCGSRFALDYLGASHAQGYAADRQHSFLSVDIGTGGSCDAAPSCPALETTDVQPVDGFWFNSARSGNGVDIHFLGDELYSAWYTGKADRTPTWLYLSSLEQDALALVAGQVSAELLRFEATSLSPLQVRSDVVGDVTLTFLDSRSALMSWVLDGVAGGEFISFLDFGGTIDTQKTDQYFNPGESGWGVGLQRQGNAEFQAIYIYAQDGSPAWVVTVDPQQLAANGSSDAVMVETHCPGCVFLGDAQTDAGDVQVEFTGANAALYSIDAQTDVPVPLIWQRTDLPFEEIVPE